MIACCVGTAGKDQASSFFPLYFCHPHFCPSTESTTSAAGLPTIPRTTNAPYDAHSALLVYSFILLLCMQAKLLLPATPKASITMPPATASSAKRRRPSPHMQDGDRSELGWAGKLAVVLIWRCLPWLKAAADAFQPLGLQTQKYDVDTAS